MAILKSEIRNKYTTIPNSVIRTKDLSDGDYRLLIFLYSLPNKWKINQGYLANEMNCNRRNVNAKIQRIKNAGYLEIQRGKNDTDYLYILKDKPTSVDDVSVNDVSSSDVSVNDTYINTNKINTEIIKKENINTTTAGNNIFDFIEENFGRTLNSIEYEKISNWEDNELTRHAIEIAVLNRVRTIPYVESILRSYKDKGIESLDEILKQEEEFKNKRQISKTKYKTKAEKIDDAWNKLAEELGEKI